MLICIGDGIRDSLLKGSALPQKHMIKRPKNYK